VLDDDEEVRGEPAPHRGPLAPVTATASSDLDTILTGWDDD
jgi:hypothetical protein